jgi:hypothetical protein
MSFDLASLDLVAEINFGLPFKEVIQPHLPVRLPCYDFTPVTSPAFGVPLLNLMRLG